MCGISGIIGPGASDSRIKRMAEIMHHRGPDDRGYFIADNVALAQNRLSIIDLSSAGHQPMFDPSGRYVIVFNGEVYNYLELKEEIGDKYPFKSRTDTEVVLASYLLYGTECVHKFNGFFAIIIYDTVERSLFVLRDRLGIKPFYYSLRGDTLFCASEIKALFAAGIEKKPDYSTIHTYLTTGYYDHSENTFYEGIKSCPQGCAMYFKDGTLSIKPYWDLYSIASAYDERNDKRSQEQVMEELNALMLDSVRLRLRSDVPVGIHLSGGLDSSILLAYLEQAMPSNGTIKATTVVYSNPKYNEANYARSIVRKLNLEHTLAEFDIKEFDYLLKKTLWHQDQPFGGISTIGSYVLDKSVRESGVIVALEGQGGDELFGGYNYFFDDYIYDIGGVNNETLPLIHKHAAYQGFSTESLIKRIETSAKGGEKLYQDGTSFLKLNCLRPEFLNRFSSDIKFPEIEGSRFKTARYRDIKHTKIPRVLRFNDAQSMAHSVELRVPILDYRIVEFAMKLPSGMFFRDGITKSLLRDLGVKYNLLPEEIAFAPKRTVVTPQREWLRYDLSSLVTERLNNSVLYELGILEKNNTLAAVDDYMSGKDWANSNYIWQWLNLDFLFSPIN